MAYLTCIGGHGAVLKNDITMRIVTGHDPFSDARWFSEFQQLLASRKFDGALRLLNDVIETDLPLFDQDTALAADRRVAWLCRIDLLRESGRLMEALAWACLECELHPDNVAALAVKEELKRLRRIGGRSPGPPGGGGSTAVVLWNGLAGMRQLRAELEEDVIRPLNDPERYAKYGLALPNGILLHGPPGCGKTFIAQILARIIEFNFYDIKPSDLGSPYVHGSQRLIKNLFDKARAAAPSMIFLDEFDALAPARDRGVGHHYESEVNELLTQLNECASQRILVVAATNRADKIDPAVLRPGRFDKHFFVGPPDLEARVELIRLYLARRPSIGVNYVELGELSDRYTPAEIRAVVDDAARKALVRGDPISHQDLTAALRERPAALQPDQVRRRRIGFAEPGRM